MTLSTNTPGWFGYLAAALASSFACGLLLLVPVVVESDGPVAALSAITAASVYLPLVTIACVLVGAPLAAVGATVVHLLCHRVRNQAVHVAVAGLVGLAGGAAYDALFFRPGGPWYVDSEQTGPWVTLSVGIAAAVGRAAVIPLVRSRRRLAAQGHLTGTAR